MDDCLFCKISKGESPCTKIYENDHVFAFLDIHPVNPGHTMVIPKNHSADLREMSQEDAAALIHAIQYLGPRISKAMGTESFNVHFNIGRPSGQMVFHTHAHIIPRHPADGHEHWKGTDEHVDFEAVGTQIRQQFS